MSADDEPGRSPESRRVRRPSRWALPALGFVAVGVVLGLGWAREPFDRSTELVASAPVRWIDAAHAVATFEPGGDGRLAVSVRFPDAPSGAGPRSSARDPLADSVVTLDVRHGDDSIAVDRRPRDDSDPAPADDPLLGQFVARPDGRWTIDLRVDRASGPFRGAAGRLEIRRDGYDVTKAYSTMWMRRINVGVVAFVLVLAIMSVWICATPRARTSGVEQSPPPG